MTVLDVVKKRRSVRLFSNKEIPSGDLLCLIDAARWAPSGSNRQPWRFIVCDDRELVDTIRAFTPGITVAVPAAIIVICVDQHTRLTKETKAETLDHMDVAMAAQNILLVAHSLGIGSCAILSFDPVAISRLVRLPHHVTPELLVTLGYPKVYPSPRKRLRMVDIVYRNIYGQPFDGAQACDNRPEGQAPDERHQLAPEPAPTAPSGQQRKQGDLRGASGRLEKDVLRVLAHALISVRLLSNEPPSYGPRRILDILVRIATLLSEHKLAPEAVRAVADDIELARATGLTSNVQDLAALVDRNLQAVEQALCDSGDISLARREEQRSDGPGVSN